MRISIIIPTFNGAHLLERCLVSISGQGFTDFEIIVVDNGSTDCTQAFVGSLGSCVKSICLPCNLGFGTAVNRGLAVSTGSLVLVLNNDTELAPDCLARIHLAAVEYPEFSFFAPLIKQFEDRGSIYAAGLMFSRVGYGNRSARFLFTQDCGNQEVFGVCGAAAVFRRDSILSVEGFNESFFLMFEDLELSFRLQLLGHRCLLVVDAVVYHVGSATLRAFFSVAVRESTKNSLFTLLQCAPSSFIWRNARDIFSFYLAYWKTLIRRGFLPSLTLGLIDFFISIPKIICSRFKIQRRSTLELNRLDALLYEGPIYINFPGGVEVIDLDCQR